MLIQVLVCDLWAGYFRDEQVPSLCIEWAECLLQVAADKFLSEFINVEDLLLIAGLSSKDPRNQPLCNILLKLLEKHLYNNPSFADTLIKLNVVAALSECFDKGTEKSVLKMLETLLHFDSLETPDLSLRKQLQEEKNLADLLMVNLDQNDLQQSLVSCLF